MLKLKEILNDIVKNTYKEDFNPSYLRFFVELSGKNLKSCHGTYGLKSHKILIHNTYRDDESILCTTIHELAHHIDNCNRGTSDHQKPFYAEYKRLLFTAMDMGIIHKDKFLDTIKDASDSNKIRKMMAEYQEHPISYRTEKKLISVYNSYLYRTELKNRGYFYNDINHCWEKEVEDVETELEFLSAFKDVEIQMNDPAALHFESTIKLEAIGDTYTMKDKLKRLGFKYKGKKWIYEAKDMEEVKHIQRLVPCKMK